MNLTLDFAEARKVFLEALFDWTDNFTENFMGSPDSEETKVNLPHVHSAGLIPVFKAAKEDIGQLWIAYAQMEISLSQFKKASEVFDKALDDPVASTCCAVYAAYARYYLDRY